MNFIKNLKKFKNQSSLKNDKNIVINKRISQLFYNLINNTIESQEKTMLNNQIINDCRTNEQILKDELSKPITIFNKYSELIKDENSRDIAKIVSCLLLLPNMPRYLKFNGIKETTLMRAAGFMKYNFFKKGSYICQQGEKSSIFYGIISGEVSIRSKDLKKELKKKEEEEKLKKLEELKLEVQKENEELNKKNNKQTNDDLFNLLFNDQNKNNNKNTKKENDEKNLEEKIVFKAGWCFGEWAVIYDTPRTASIYCLTDVELFTLEKQYFNQTFSKEIVRADFEKKNFVSQKIPNFQADSVQFLLPNIIPCFYDFGQIIYTEFEKATFIYVLFQGECIVKKFLNPDEKKKTVDKMTVLFKVDKGCVLGLESIIPNSNYETNLIANQDFTILYKIKLSELKKFSYDPKSLEPMLKIYQKLIKESIEKDENTKQLKKFNKKKFDFSSNNINIDKTVTKYADHVLNTLREEKEDKILKKTNFKTKYKSCRVIKERNNFITNTNLRIAIDGFNNKFFINSSKKNSKVNLTDKNREYKRNSKFPYINKKSSSKFKLINNNNKTIDVNLNKKEMDEINFRRTIDTGGDFIQIQGDNFKNGFPKIIIKHKLELLNKIKSDYSVILGMRHNKGLSTGNITKKSKNLTEKEKEMIKYQKAISPNVMRLLVNFPNVNNLSKTFYNSGELSCPFVSQ
jgi:CRP-like cAMP-binding protein